ncbi:SxtJ family membrane protein [Marinimicrococcus flavescens]|uniref:SxtJ family membrane protein n=1 Tax=Marinimicrococcus flavescens TaxID=3031815 RepID=A0AAP3XQV7_9PROT|nr:SxtJ family membrane protein [Marinimicrococcus flavescens]
MAGRSHESFEAHEEEEVAGPSERSFGLTVGGILLALGLLRELLGSGFDLMALPLLAIGGLLALAGLVAPRLLAPLNRAWTRLGLVLFKVVNPVVMLLIYATTVVPIGLLMRLAGKDPLRLRKEPAAASYWIDRDPPGPAPETMINQF